MRQARFKMYVIAGFVFHSGRSQFSNLKLFIWSLGQIDELIHKNLFFIRVDRMFSPIFEEGISHNLAFFFYFCWRIISRIKIISRGVLIIGSTIGQNRVVAVPQDDNCHNRVKLYSSPYSLTADTTGVTIKCYSLLFTYF